MSHYYGMTFTRVRKFLKRSLCFLLVALMVFSCIITDFKVFGQTVSSVSVDYVAVGPSNVTVVANDGTVKGWGFNYNYELGMGNTSNILIPTTISGLTGVVQLSSGQNHSFAVMADGTVKAWGNNSYYQLGLGDTTTRTTPTSVTSLSNVKQIASGYMFSLALMQDGTVKAWGYNNCGQLGLGDTSTRTTPIQVTSLSNVKQIVAGYDFAYALMNDGTVKVWGNNNNYQLGLSDTTIRYTPTVNSNLTGVMQLVAGYNFGLALFNNTSVKAWGYNNYGQLGLGNTTTATTPTLITTLIGVSRLAAGYYHTLALMEDGSVKAWGYNVYGQLGDGTTSNQTIPVLVSALSDIQGIYAGQYHSIAFSKDKMVYSWGYNNNGQLGQNDTTQRITPTLITNLKIAAKEPYINVIAPLANSSLSDSDKAFIPKIAVRDTEKDSLVCMMYIDSEVTQRDTKVATVIPSSGTDAEVAFNPINLSTLSEGQHTMKFTVSNGIATGQAIVSFLIDKTNAPGSISVIPDKYSMSVTGATTDVYPGLAPKPYRVTLTKGGTLFDDSGWLSESSNPVTASSNVVNAAYSTAGNGGRKLVKLGNGWLVAGVVNSTTNIRFYVSKDNGNTWSTLAYRTTGTTINGLALTVFGNMVHYLTTTGTTVIYGKIDALTASGQDITSTGVLLDTQPYVGACSLEAAEDGYLHAVWSAKSSSVNPNCYNLRYSKSNGINWNQEWLTDSNYPTADFTQPCILVNQNNNPIIFASCNSNIDCLMSNGTTWGPIVVVYFGGPYNQYNPSAVIDNSGKIHVVWQGSDFSYPISNIRYAYSNDGNSWTGSCQLLTQESSYAQTSPTITADNNNNLSVLWQGINSTTNTTYTQIRKKEYKVSSNSWGAIVNITANNSGNATNPSSCIDSGFSSPLNIYTDAQTSMVRYSGTVNTGRSYITHASLTPNTFYSVKLQIKSLSGNIQCFTKDVYTLADTPVIQCNSTLTGILSVKVSDNNPSYTNYQMMCGNKYVTESGELSSYETWIELPEKAVTVTGLQGQTDRIIKIKARNGDGVESTYVTTDTDSSDDQIYTKIACGSDHAIGLKSNGTVWTWGYNNKGQLGDGTTTDRNTPGQVIGLSDVQSIAAGYYHTIALKSDGTVWTWGYNNYGQLGDGTTTDRVTPIQVTGLNGIIAIAGGCYHTIALKNDGTVWTWGYNNYSQLGDGTTTNRNSPVQVTGLSNVTAIAGGYYHTIALSGDRTVWTWGRNNYGQLGDGTTTNRNAPVQVTGLSDIRALASGSYYTIALQNDGTVWTWGYNNSGQLGNGTTTNRTTPTQVTGLSSINAITGGISHTIALKNDGTVWTWGYNNYGQLGDGTTTNRTNPVQVTGLSGVTAIAGGKYHTIALKNDGTVWTWGYNNYGQLGDGTTAINSIPIQVIGLSNIASIAGGYCDSVALTSVGIVRAWGYNYNGQLGDGTTTDKNTPVQVASLSEVKAIIAGNFHTAALKSDGTVWTWGYNSYGQLGDGTTTTRITPVQVTSLSNVKAIVRGYYHTIALKNDGTVWTWGYNNYGQLGDGTTTNQTIPVQVTGLSGITAIAGGNYHTIALKYDGTVWTWGNNNYGQLGDGTTTNKIVPVQVTTLGDIKAIWGGYYQTTALKNDGTVWTWGYNCNGKLGDGTTTNRSTPVQVRGLNDVKAISGGDYHTIALKNDGTVWAWGNNNYGQLGDATTTTSYVPVQVTRLSDITIIASGDSHNIALKKDGTVWTWGYNNYGQLGNGSVLLSKLANHNYGSFSNIFFTSVKPKGLSFSFSSIVGSLGYNIQRNGYTISNTRNTEFTDTKLLPNTQYTYRVRSLSTISGYSEWSDPTSIYTLANIPVKNTLATSKNSGIKATWLANGNPIGTEYCLAAFDSAGTLIQQDPWIASLSDTLIGLSPSMTYTIKVKARNGDGVETDWCELGTAMPTPSAPTISKQPSHGTFTEINWPAVPGAIWYDVEADGKVIEKASVTKDISNNYTYKHASLKPLSQHTYRVRARNISGTGEWSDLLTVSTSSGIPTTAPTLSPDLQRATNTTITLSWTDVPDAEFYDIAEVINENDKKMILENYPNTTCEIQGLVPGSTHKYKVCGKNSMSTLEEPLIWGEITIKTNLLDTPSNIIYTESDNSITLNWGPVAGATSYSVTIDNSTPVTGIAATTYTVNGLAQDTRITYSIKAVNASGESAWSSEAPAFTLPSKPGIPANVSATVTDKSITISWDEVHNSDGSNLTDPEGYDVELDGVLLENDCSTIYIHDELDPYTLHTYRVRARNLSVPGDWSPLESIRTLPGKPKAPSGITVTSTQTSSTVSWSPEPGATGYDIQIFDGVSTTTEYNIQKTSFTHHKIGTGKECRYMVRTHNSEGTSAWSGVIINNALKANCKKKENVDLGLTATDVTDFSPYTMVVTYNPGVIDVVDLCTQTGTLETKAGKIKGTDIEIIEFIPGRMVFKVDKVIEPGEAWTGVINSIKFKAKETGGTTITYTVFCKPEIL